MQQNDINSDLAAIIVPDESARELLEEIFGGGGSRILPSILDGSVIRIQKKDLKGITEIVWPGFVACDQLESIEFSESLEQLGSWIFSQCTNLTSITFYGKTPPQIQLDTFMDLNPQCIIYVPADAIENYKNAENWESVEQIIQPISEDITQQH